ncbi:MAG: rod shape-determining protein MreD [Bacillota bacterium]|nr:rod shape-determining protein MreD [Bacillota bacterium]
MHLRLGLLLLLLTLLETTVIPFARILGIGPNLILLEIVAVALFRGPLAGALLGLAGGALLDLWRGQALGLFALAGGITGYLLGLLEPRLFKDNLLVPALAGLTGTLLFQGAFLLLSSFTGARFPVWPALGRVILPEALYNAVLGPLMFRIVANLLRSRGVATVAGKENA